MPKSAIVLVFFQAASKDLKANVVLRCRKMQKLLEFFKNSNGRYICVNTRMDFDTDLLLKDTKNEKVLFKTADEQLKRFSSKIIKMDESNQYGMAMTRPLPYGCIKRKKNIPSFEELNELLKSVTLKDKIGHIFTDDIVFSDINPKTLLFNEI